LGANHQVKYLGDTSIFETNLAINLDAIYGQQIIVSFFTPHEFVVLSIQGLPELNALTIEEVANILTKLSTCEVLITEEKSVCRRFDPGLGHHS